MLGVLIRRCILRSFAFALTTNPQPFRPDSPPWRPGAVASSRPPDHSSPSVRLRRCTRSENGLTQLGREIGRSPGSAHGIFALRSVAHARRLVASPQPQPTCRSSNNRAAVLGSGSKRQELSENGRVDQRPFAAASGFSAWQAVPANDMAGQCCHGVLLFQVFGRTCAPAGSRHLGRPPARGVLLPVPNARELDRRFSPPALQRIRQASA